jgi:ubiquinone biosynthesis monooxygenase Coq7
MTRKPDPARDRPADPAEAKTRSRLPGDPRPEAQIARMIRVDQAGEYGARRIYEGQLAVLGEGHPEAPAIRGMYEQELRHLETFDSLLGERRVRPTALQPVWHLAGFALGAATAMMGARAAMACTVAIEEVIDEHYRKQAARLDDGLPGRGARAPRPGAGPRRGRGPGLRGPERRHQGGLAAGHMAFRTPVNGRAIIPKVGNIDPFHRSDLDHRQGARCAVLPAQQAARNAAGGPKRPASGGAARAAGVVAALARCPASRCTPRLPGRPDPHP